MVLFGGKRVQVKSGKHVVTDISYFNSHCFLGTVQLWKQAEVDDVIFFNPPG